MDNFALSSLLTLSLSAVSSAGREDSFTTLSVLNAGRLNTAVTSVVCILILILCVLMATYVYWPVRVSRQTQVRT